MLYLTDPANILRSVDIVFQVMAKAAYQHNGLFPAVTERQNGMVLMDFPLPPPTPPTGRPTRPRMDPVPPHEAVGERCDDHFMPMRMPEPCG